METSFAMNLWKGRVSKYLWKPVEQFILDGFLGHTLVNKEGDSMNFIGKKTYCSCASVIEEKPFVELFLVSWASSRAFNISISSCCS